MSCKYRGVCMFSHSSGLTLCDPMDPSQLASLSTEFSMQKCWSEWSFPPPGSSQSKDQTHISYISCIGRRILYNCCHLGSPKTGGGVQKSSAGRLRSRDYLAISQLTPMAYGALPTANIRHRMPSKKETPWDSCGLKPLRIPPKFCVLSPEE